MTLSAANPGGWSLNEVLTSAQMTFLQNELLKAIDGVNGGAYTLASVLTLQGADVTFNSDINLNAGAELNFAGGTMTGAINVDSAGDMTFLSGSTLTMAAGSSLSIGGSMTVTSLTVTSALSLSSASFNVDAPSTINLLGSLAVNGGGSIDVTGGGDINLTSADFTVNSGGQILLSGGSIIIGATGFIQANGGDITLGSTSFLNLSSGAGIVGANGSTIQIEDSNDLLINGSTENFRLALAPFHIQLNAGTSEPRWKMASFGTWTQQESAAVGGYTIAFPLPLPPGDVVSFIGMFIDGGPALPAFLPKIEVVKVSSGGVATTVARTADTSASSGAYDAIHLVSLLNGSETFGAMPFTVTSDPHYVLVTGEIGGTDNTLQLLSILGQATANSFRGTGSTMVYS
jgi:hypothetical protein